MFKVGDMVARSDVDERSIPAFAALRGRVVEVNADGSRARVHWTCDADPEFGMRGADTIRVVDQIPPAFG